MKHPAGALADFEFAGFDLDQSSDVWVVGIGAAYTLDAWTFGAQYAHLDLEVRNIDSFADAFTDTEIDRAAPELDNYDALEIGIGTAITF